MSKNTIKIKGDKLKDLLENKTGLSLYDLSINEGFSRNFLTQACRSGKASPIVQSIAKRYDIAPVDYQLIEFKHSDKPEQLTFDDLERLKKEELLNLIKEAVRDVIREELSK